MRFLAATALIALVPFIAAAPTADSTGDSPMPEVGRVLGQRSTLDTRNAHPHTAYTGQKCMIGMTWKGTGTDSQIVTLGLFGHNVGTGQGQAYINCKDADCKLGRADLTFKGKPMKFTKVNGKEEIQIEYGSGNTKQTIKSGQFPRCSTWDTALLCNFECPDS